MTRESKLVNAIGKPAMLEQTAEEAIELAFVCLKLARMIRGENKVHGRTYEELMDGLHEEIADITVCADELVKGEMISIDMVADIYDEKCKRMLKRLKEDHDGE